MLTKFEDNLRSILVNATEPAYLYSTKFRNPLEANDRSLSPSHIRQANGSSIDPERQRGSPHYQITRFETLIRTCFASSLGFEICGQ